MVEVPGGTPGAGGTGGISASAMLGLAVPATHMVADAKRKRLYATVGGAAARLPNRLVTIDAIENSIIHDVPIGSEPTTLAIADDGSTLWVSLSSAGAVRRVDISGDEPVPGVQFSLPSTCLSGPCVAGDMVVLPGTTGSLVTTLRARGGGLGAFGVTVFDDGVARAKQIGMSSSPTILALGPPGRVWGFNGGNSGFAFYAISVDPSGLAATMFSGLISGFDTEIAYADGFVFASSGDVVDVSSPETPVHAGTFQQRGAVLALPTHGEALMFWFMAGIGQSTTTLFVDQLHAGTSSMSRVMTMRLNLPIVPGQEVAIRNLVSLGDRVAFLLGGAGEPSNVYIVTGVPGLNP